MSRQNRADGKLPMRLRDRVGLPVTASHPEGELGRGIVFGTAYALHAMRQSIVKQFNYNLTPVAGLALVVHYLKALRPVFARLEQTAGNR